VRLGHVDRGALVPRIDDPDAFEIGLHPDRHDVTAAQAEEAIDSLGLEKSRNDGCGGIVSKDQESVP
jgi:hypothetical protein